MSEFAPPAAAETHFSWVFFTPDRAFKRGVGPRCRAVTADNRQGRLVRHIARARQNVRGHIERRGDGIWQHGQAVSQARGRLQGARRLIYTTA